MCVCVKEGGWDCEGDCVCMCARMPVLSVLSPQACIHTHTCSYRPPLTHLGKPLQLLQFCLIVSHSKIDLSIRT